MTTKKPIARQSAECAANKAKRVGLARALSKLGFCSRTQAMALIREGQVRLNGTTPRNPETPVRLGVDRIEIAGGTLRAAEKIYVMMNKPRGIVTSAADEKGRDTEHLTSPGSALGTVSYMSPEQVLGNPPHAQVSVVSRVAFLPEESFRSDVQSFLPLAKMPSGANAFEISNIQKRKLRSR